MPPIDVLVLSILLGYLLGSIPVASLVSRRRRVNIFSTGTGLPGAANVFRNVGHKSGLLVSAGDAAKGALAIGVASCFGIDGAWILLAGAAAIGGHWRSIFTRFRGGDGMATMVGITLGALPTYGLIAVSAGIIVGLWFRHSAHSTFWGGITCYSLLPALSLVDGADTAVSLGVVTLAIMVMTHAVIGHRRRRPVLPDYDYDLS